MANRESKGGRLDRELGELLQELRVALPGVQVLVSSTRLAIAGTVALALAITGAVMFTTDVLFGVPVAAGVAAAVAGLLAWFWFALPLLRRVRDRS